MKVVFVLLTIVGLVWGVVPQPQPTLKEEEITIFIRPGESRVINLGSPDEKQPESKPLDGYNLQNTTTTPSTTTNAPTTEKNFPIDLSQRLFYANHEDSQFHRKTLDLSGLDLNGRDVMKILHSLNETVLASVARLDLSHNRVSTLPPRVWPMEMEYSLRELRLDYNRLYLEDPINRENTCFELLRLLSLKKLSMTNCGLKNHVSSSELAFPSVESLDLSHNHFYDIPSRVVKIVTIEHLNMSHNSIRYLDGQQLSALTNLRSLDLSYNNMEVLQDDPLESMAKLETIYLDHNSLSEVPSVYKFTGSYQPRINVYLSGNKFMCGCDLKDFVDMDRVQVEDFANVTCLDGSHVEHLIENELDSSCSHRWDSVHEKFSGARRWVRENLPHWDTIFHSLGWLLWVMLGVLLTIVYTQRQLLKKRNPPPAEVPYDVLSDGAVY
ncbi:leucine-rich repeat protein soc-2 homolog [Macrosteles quadrilineatus]|uniref:leucine-rich repeat protein soc-2 homolog n=1 Tax=Macrosteles quadrilineatus TaxID=74068 RepID=UPI0023E0D4CC|nr:leucine-rich repeat protein soc-2 homolog [Macrosteles quadrilineatus]